MDYIKETWIPNRRAKRILADLGRADQYVEGADYFVGTTGDGEWLHMAGMTDPEAYNPSTMSWLGSQPFSSEEN